MALQGTALSILRDWTGDETINEYGLNDFERKFSTLSGMEKAQYYVTLPAKIGSMELPVTPLRRYIEDIFVVRKGDGSQAYLLTGVAPAKGSIYSPVYDSNAAANFLLGNHESDIRKDAIAQVRNEQYVVTIKMPEIRTVMFSGALDLAARQHESLQNGDYIEEYRMLSGTIFEALRRPGYAAVVTTPEPTDEASFRKFSAILGGTADNLTFPSDQYNAQKIPKGYKREDLRLLVRVSTKRELFTSSYADVFNLNYARGLADDFLVEFPDSMWPSDMDDVLGILFAKGDEPTFILVDNEIHPDAFVNPGYQSVNQTLVHNSVFGVNTFAPLVAIKVGAPMKTGSAVPVPTSVEFEVLLNGNPVTPGTGEGAPGLRRGEEYKLRAFAKDVYGNTAGRANVAITGQTSPTGATFVQRDDIDLYIGLDEASDAVKLTASASLNSDIKTELEFKIVGQQVSLRPPIEFVTVLTASNVATVSGNTITPPATPSPAYNLTYAGKVGGNNVSGAFTEAITVTQAGDSVTVTANANDGYTLKGTKTRKVNFS